MRVWVCGERYVIGKSCKKVKESFKNENKKVKRKENVAKKLHKREKPEKTCGGGGSVAGRMTLSGRVVSSERGGRGSPSWWTLVGTNTGGRTGRVGSVGRV